MTSFQSIGREAMACKVMNNHFDRLFEVVIATRRYTEYDMESLAVIDTGDYDTRALLLVGKLAKEDRPEFLNAIALQHVLMVLADESLYQMRYRIESESIVREYQLNISYSDAQKDCLMVTRQPGSGNYLQYANRAASLQHDRERFRFLIRHICEDFFEVNVQTGACIMMHGTGSMVEKSTFKEQVAWWAQNIVVPEERARYLAEYELSTLVETLRAHNNLYRTTYMAIYGGSRRCLLIVSALMKEPYNPDEEYIFSYAQDITTLKEQEERNKQLVDISRQLLSLSQIEPMTHLLNRAASEQLIIEHLAESGVCDPGTLLIIDIDHFKWFNDTYGHQVGDIVLKEFGRAMKDVFRSDDILCRWGGDEFLVFLRNVNNIRSIEGRIERLRLKMRHYENNGTPLAVTISVGGVVAVPGISFEALFKAGDKALYQVKEKGRDGFFIIERG